MNDTRIARELVRVAKDLLSMEFDTEEAYKKYMKEHPGADRSKHTVKKVPAKKKSPDVKKQTEQELKSGLGQWVKDYQEARKSNPDMARKIKKNIDKVVSDKGLDSDMVYGV